MKNALTGISRIFLLLCLASAFVADLTVFIVLLVQGAGVKFWIFPMFFAIADGIFIVQASLSNFRFSYTIGEIVFYMLVSAVMLVCTLAVSIFGGLTVFSTTAGALWTVLHVVVMSAVLASYLYASKRVRGGKATQIAIASAFTAVCLIFTAYYATFLFGMGFFGQGPMQVRTLAYEYNEEEDCYEVKSVLNGRGNAVYVPEEFNGKRVERVSSAIFCANGVNSVTLACSPSVEFTDLDTMGAPNSDLSVYTAKDDIMAYREAFYGIYRNGNKSALELANKTVPSDVEKNEVFVTFSYGEEAFSEADGVTLPVWYGKKGDRLDMSYFKDIPYAIHSNALSDEDLHYNYLNNNGYIISPLEADGKALAGSAISESLHGVEISFQKIYKIYAGDGNDEKHASTVDFKPSQIAGSPSFNAKYTTAKNADAILSDFERDGFDLTWAYTDKDSTRKSFVSLNAVLSGLPAKKELTICPAWSLQAPTLTVEGVKAVTYGDDITLNAVAKAPADGVKLSYEWTANGADGGKLDSLQIKNIPYIDGTYPASVRVTASADFTSLTSTVNRVVDITVNQRPLNVFWTMPEGDDAVYNADYKTVTCAIDPEGLINGDSVSLAESQFNNYRNAGTYFLTARVSGSGEGYKYCISSSTQSRSFTIKKAPLTAVWSNTTTTFNGNTQYPTVELSGVCSGDSVSKSVSGALHAGTHTVKCTLNSTANYDLTNPEFTEFIIEKLPVDIKRAGNTDSKFTYDGIWHDVMFVGVAVDGYTYNYSITATPSLSRIKDAGTYDITATVGNDFVIASGSPMQYTIDKCASQHVYTESQRLTYNGYEQAPKCYILGVGLEYNQKIYIDGAGAYKDASVGDSKYTFTANTPQNDNYEAYNVVYYTIAPRTVNAVWSNSIVTYNGQEQKPEVHAYGVGGDGELKLQLYSPTGFTTANNHTVIATIVDGDNYLARNYELSYDSSSKQFLIERVNLTAKADDITITEGEALPALTYTVTGFVNGEHFDYPFTCEIEGYSGGNLSAGTYTIRVYSSGSSSSTSYPSGNYVVYYKTGTLTVRPRGEA